MCCLSPQDFRGGNAVGENVVWARCSFVIEGTVLWFVMWTARSAFMLELGARDDGNAVPTRLDCRVGRLVHEGVRCSVARSDGSGGRVFVREAAGCCERVAPCIRKDACCAKRGLELESEGGGRASTWRYGLGLVDWRNER